MAFLKVIKSSSKDARVPSKNGNKTKKTGKNDDLSTSSSAFSQHTSKRDVLPFLQKLYDMITACDAAEPNLAQWTSDGSMFVVKDPKRFAKDIIPQYYDHSNLNSFVRQLNYYDFSKVKTKPPRKVDFDKSTAKHITFCNTNFKQGETELLSEIKRSTKKQTLNAHDKKREIEQLKEQIEDMRGQVIELTEKAKVDEHKHSQTEKRLLALEQFLKMHLPQHVPRLEQDNAKEDCNSLQRMHPSIEFASHPSIQNKSRPGNLSSLPEELLQAPIIDVAQDPQHDVFQESWDFIQILELPYSEIPEFPNNEQSP